MKPGPSTDIPTLPRGTLVADTLEAEQVNTTIIHAMTMSNTTAPEITLHRQGLPAAPTVLNGDILGDVNLKARILPVQ